jgi:hypothetical protein
MDSASVVVAAPHVLARELDGEMVVFEPRSNRCYGLEAVAARVWALMREPTTVERLEQAIVGEYDVAPDRCQRDVRDFLGVLLERGLIEVECATHNGATTGGHRDDRP